MDESVPPQDTDTQDPIDLSQGVEPASAPESAPAA